MMGKQDQEMISSTQTNTVHFRTTAQCVEWWVL